MTISEKGLDLIKEFEGFRSEPYNCSAGVATIGYGNTMYNDGTRVTLQDASISIENATDMLEKQVNDSYGKCVDDNALPATQVQFDAMVSFTYNLGCGAFKSSTLLKRHKAGLYEQAGNEFLKWNKSNGKVLKGLTRRRKAERSMYLNA